MRQAAEHQQQQRHKGRKACVVDATDYPINYAVRVHDTLFVSLDATQVDHLSAQGERWLGQLLQQQICLWVRRGAHRR